MFLRVKLFTLAFAAIILGKEQGSLNDLTTAALKKNITGAIDDSSKLYEQTVEDTSGKDSTQSDVSSSIVTNWSSGICKATERADTAGSFDEALKHALAKRGNSTRADVLFFSWTKGNEDSTEVCGTTEDENTRLCEEPQGNDSIEIMKENVANTTRLLDKTSENISVEKNITQSDVVSLNLTKVNCSTERIYGMVEIVNTTRLPILEPGPSNRSRSDGEEKRVPRVCVIVLFYARWCVFSSQAAPHFNALPRFFPHIKAVAIDAMKHQSYNTQYGIVGVPTVMLIHNGKPVAKFNDTTYTLESFSKFITQLTTLKPNGSLYVTSADFAGPLSSTPSNETDYCLLVSWAFILACALYYMSQSRWWKQFMELVQNTWRESNAQHEHVD